MILEQQTDDKYLSAIIRELRADVEGAARISSDVAGDEPPRRAADLLEEREHLCRTGGVGPLVWEELDPLEHPVLVGDADGRAGLGGERRDAVDDVGERDRSGRKAFADREDVGAEEELLAVLAVLAVGRRAGVSW